MGSLINIKHVPTVSNPTWPPGSVGVCPGIEFLVAVPLLQKTHPRLSESTGVQTEALEKLLQ